MGKGQGSAGRNAKAGSSFAAAKVNNATLSQGKTDSVSNELSDSKTFDYVYLVREFNGARQTRDYDRLNDDEMKKTAEKVANLIGSPQELKSNMQSEIRSRYGNDYSIEGKSLSYDAKSNSIEAKFEVWNKNTRIASFTQNIITRKNGGAARKTGDVRVNSQTKDTPIGKDLKKKAFSFL